MAAFLVGIKLALMVVVDADCTIGTITVVGSSVTSTRGTTAEAIFLPHLGYPSAITPALSL